MSYGHKCYHIPRWPTFERTSAAFDTEDLKSLLSHLGSSMVFVSDSLVFAFMDPGAWATTSPKWRCFSQCHCGHADPGFQCSYYMQLALTPLPVPVLTTLYACDQFLFLKACTQLALAFAIVCISTASLHHRVLAFIQPSTAYILAVDTLLVCTLHMCQLIATFHCSTTGSSFCQHMYSHHQPWPLRMQVHSSLASKAQRTPTTPVDTTKPHNIHC